MATASLTVRIAADINDFARQLNKVTKDVEKAADRIASMGTAMTIGITAPVALATVGLSKFAMENDRVAKQFEQSFGPSVKMIRDQLTDLAKVMPVTATEMEQSAIRMNNFTKGLGLAAPQAAQLSVELLRMSNDLAAFSGNSQEAALDALMRGLEGATRGLKSMGVVIDQAQVMQEAFRLGLVHVGQDLTPVGTALATYSLITKQAALWTGRGAEAAQDAQGKWQMLWRDLMQLADDASNVLIPTLHSIVGVLTEFVRVVREIPAWVLKVGAALAIFAAVLGPTIVLVAKLVSTFNLLRGFLTVLAGDGGLAKAVSILAAPEVLGVILLLGGAVAGLTYLWSKFNKTVEGTPKPKVELPKSVQDLLKLGGKNDPTAMAKGDPLSQLMKSGSLAEKAWQSAITTGDAFGIQLEHIVDVQKEAYKLFDQSSDKFGEMAQGALELYFRLREIRTVAGVAFNGKSVQQASSLTTSDNQIQMNLARGFIENETQLRTREAALKIPDAFNAVREAAIQFGENFREVSRDLAKRAEMLKLPVQWNQVRMQGAVEHGEAARNYQQDLLKRSIAINLPDYFDALRQATVELSEGFRRTDNEFALGWTKLKQQWSSPRMIGASALDGLKAGMTDFLNVLSPASLAFMALQRVMQPIINLISLVMEPLAALGKILAIIAGPVMRPLFEALKVLGIVTAYLSEIVSRVAAAIAHVVASVVRAIAGLIGWIPGLGGAARSLRNFADSLDRYGNDAQDHANELQKARSELEHMHFGDTADKIGALGDAAQTTAEALLNIPTGFRIALARYYATVPVDVPNPLAPTPTSSTPSTPGNGPVDSGGSGVGGGSGGGTTVFLMMDGKVLAKGVVQNLQRIAQAQLGSSVQWSEVTV